MSQRENLFTKKDLKQIPNVPGIMLVPVVGVNDDYMCQYIIAAKGLKNVQLYHTYTYRCVGSKHIGIG